MIYNSNWMNDPSTTDSYVLFFFFPLKKIGINHHLIKLAPIAVSIISIRFSIFLRRLFGGGGWSVIQSFILNETG